MAFLTSCILPLLPKELQLEIAFFMKSSLWSALAVAISFPLSFSTLAEIDATSSGLIDPLSASLANLLLIS